ncbi:hypothetical protein LEP1GSC075_2485, partial [Leptospira interrogans str. Kito]
SRCYLFNYMLWLEELGGKENFFVKTLNRGVPSFYWTYKMT